MLEFLYVYYMVYHISNGMLTNVVISIVLYVELKNLKQTFSHHNLHLPLSGVFYVEMMAL